MAPPLLRPDREDIDDETPPQAGPPTAPENATADRTLSVSELDVTQPDLPSAALQPTSARFTLLEPLAHGGMGEVWRARDTRLGREVALKTLLPALAENAEAFLRLRTEAELTAQLRHPGVLCVIDAGTFADGRFWYTMPIVEGRTFGAEITEGHRQTHAGERPASSVLHHLMTHFLVICQVMAHAHERGIIHRDLKPANVMVGRFGEVFVMDWGLAKALDAAEVGQNGGAEGIALVSPKTETHYGAIMGTPAYMPPEQAAGRLEAVDRRSDVYALGAVLWHVLAGGPPGRIGHAPADSPLHPEPALWDIATGAMASEPAASGRARCAKVPRPVWSAWAPAPPTRRSALTGNWRTWPERWSDDFASTRSRSNRRCVRPSRWPRTWPRRARCWPTATATASSPPSSSRTHRRRPRPKRSCGPPVPPPTPRGSMPAPDSRSRPRRPARRCRAPP